jgi:hypothetical protein
MQESSNPKSQFAFYSHCAEISLTDVTLILFKLRLPVSATLRRVQSNTSDFGFQIQESSNPKSQIAFYSHCAEISLTDVTLILSNSGCRMMYPFTRIR